jgi:hypothetical protein
MRSGIQRTALSGHPRSRESATYVHDPGHCEPPAGRRRNRSVPGYETRSQTSRSSPADRIGEGKKRFCCVTTRRRKFRLLNILGHGLGLLTARFLFLGMLGLDGGGLATFSLSSRRQPAVDLSPAFRILAVALVPTPRVVLATALFVDAGSLARAARSGFGTGLFFNVVVAHGRFCLPRESSGRMLEHSPRALSKLEQDACLPVCRLFENKTERQTVSSTRPEQESRPLLTNDRLLANNTES